MTTEKKENNTFKIAPEDLDLIDRGTSNYQKLKSIFRRALVRALRKNRLLGPDDDDGLGSNTKFGDVFQVESSDSDQE